MRPLTPESQPDVEARLAELKLGPNLLNAAELDQEPVDQQEEFVEKKKGPTGLFSLFKTDQLQSSKLAASYKLELPLQDKEFSSTNESILRDLLYRDAMSSYSKDRDLLYDKISLFPSGHQVRYDNDFNHTKQPDNVNINFPLPINLYPNPEKKEEANVSAIELSSDNLAKVKETDEEEIERAENAEEEHRDADQAKEKERKTTLVEGFTQWVSNVCSGIWGWFSGKKNNTSNEPTKAPERSGKPAVEQGFDTKPQLKAPEAVDTLMLQRFLDNEKAALRHQKDLLEQNDAETALMKSDPDLEKKLKGNMTPEEEVKMLKDYIGLMKKSQKLRQTDELIAKDGIFENQKRQEELQEQVNKEFEKIAQRSWIGKIIQWVQAALTTSMIVTSIVAVATGGFGVVLKLVDAFLALLAGALQATKAVLDYQSRQGRAKITQNHHEMGDIRTKMNDYVRNMQQAMEAINSQWQMMSMAAKAHYEANRFALTGKTSAIG